MSSFTDDFLKNFGPQVTDQLQRVFNLQGDQAREVLGKVGPLIMGGLKRQAESGGEARVNHILQKYGRESALEDLDGHFQRQAENPNPDPNLGGLLGGAGAQAVDLMKSQLGISPATAMKLIPLLAPLILGALKRQANGAPTGGGGGGLPNLGALGGLLKILDRDGDGNVLDDVAGILFRGGSAPQSPGQASGGGLGALISKLLSLLFGKKS